MWDLHHLFNGSYIDLLLIFLGFFAGRAVQYREALYLVIFLLRLLLWIVQKGPEGKKKNIELMLKGTLDHIMLHHHKLLHDDQAGGEG